ncbi:MAG: SDR family oxidoreductase [Alphaproteobacteria bacterium]
MSFDPASLDFKRLGPPPGAKVVVAGGCGGIGRSVVKACIETGLRTTVLDLAESHRRHPSPNEADFVAIDAHEETSIVAAFEEIRVDGEIDALINLVGYRDDLINVGERDTESWDDIISGNLRSAFLICRHGLAHMAANSAIVNVSSGLAVRVLPGYAPYSAAKAGVIALTKGIAIENAPRVRANAVAPAAVKTAFLAGGTGRVDDEDGDWDGQFSGYIKSIPMDRLAVAEDIVGPILFLAGPASCFMTGQVLYVNGGGLTP